MPRVKTTLKEAKAVLREAKKDAVAAKKVVGEAQKALLEESNLVQAGKVYRAAVAEHIAKVKAWMKANTTVNDIQDYDG